MPVTNVTPTFITCIMIKPIVQTTIARIHRDKGQEKDKDTEFRDDDLEKDTIYRVK